MKNIEEYDDLLWSYLDNSLSSKEKKELETKLSENKALSLRLEEFKSLTNFTKKNILATPSERFTQIVMSKIDDLGFQPKKSHWLLVITVIMTVIGCSFYISQYDTTMQLNLPSYELPLLESYLPSEGLNFTKNINLDIVSKVLLYSVTFLGLLLFDRAILKPYFKSRRLAS
ncbi:anti-sigma factor family protein [Fulvivirga lutea]|uniref:Zinc-finger domain-containing protein n=1 Tax=Fulvivirga lutea TaxID=2810512 RepID=A0A974WI10_9BACT|nr:hypothetical protein [Fulvivirga lutea]QSE98939.1 hypothetical protein JR347_07610 [Fulvivirga lutea]